MGKYRVFIDVVGEPVKHEDHSDLTAAIARCRELRREWPDTDVLSWVVDVDGGGRVL